MSECDKREATAEEKFKQVHIMRLMVAEATQQARIVSGLVGRGAGGREISLAITKLQEAKMWGGKVLGELGQQPPEGYANDEPAE